MVKLLRLDGRDRGVKSSIPKKGQKIFQMADLFIVDLVISRMVPLPRLQQCKKISYLSRQTWNYMENLAGTTFSFKSLNYGFYLN